MSEVKKLRLREDIPSSYKWNIEKIYKDSTQWEEEFENLKGKSKSLLNFQGTVKDKENLKIYMVDRLKTSFTGESQSYEPVIMENDKLM